ncbi:hypothetical protein EHQ19_19100 [Leptospira montravelensis]|uniref:hypothetical protein n=1 Tax=Leptospira montravelensis TaxID=2484961 RepID=UPI0010839625|nr:hypothetical protein [Leptospira montravelensis]TGK77534.1 hypothetical protein EHQ19_19100 [Leptospira montravelensis]
MNKLERTILIIAIAGIGTTIAPIVTYLYSFGFKISKDHEIWAQTGDFFGGTINPILSFLSFLALLITISIQIKEHRATLFELEETKKIHSEQSSIFAAQNAEIIKNKYETRFFQLINITNSLEEKINYNGFGGSASFDRAVFDIEKLIEQYYMETDKILLEKIQFFFDSYYKVFDYYIKNLMFIVDFVLNLKAKRILDNEEIDFYFSTIRSQLTNSKQNFIFYAALVYSHPDLSKEKLKESKMLIDISHTGYVQDFSFRFKEITKRFYR